MANVNNAGTITGRLAADPVSFINADGSKKVMLTVYADRNFKNSATGQRDSDRVSLETFVRAETEGLGIFGHMHKGDLVGLGYTVRAGQYADKATGEVIYFQVLRVEDVSLLESLATTNERLAARLSAVQDAAAPAAAASPLTTNTTLTASGDYINTGTSTVTLTMGSSTVTLEPGEGVAAYLFAGKWYWTDPTALNTAAPGGGTEGATVWTDGITKSCSPEKLK